MSSNTFVLPALSDYKKRQLISAAQDVLLAQQSIQKYYGGLLHFMLAHHGYEEGANEQFIKNIHYPNGDRIDYSNGSQYFYHCHREDVERAEHGHFHTFIRGKFFPKSYKRKAILEAEKFDNNPMTHLICIALNQYGLPCRLFSVNRWVSHEVWFDSDYSKKLLKRFSPLHIKPKPEWQIIDNWINSMMHLFRYHIEWLIDERDNKIEEMKHCVDAKNPYLNQHADYEELSSLEVSLEEQIAWLSSS